MAAIMTAHMMNTASQFASDQSDMGIVSCAAGLSIWVAPQTKSSQHPSVAAKIPAAVPEGAKIKLRGGAVTSRSALIGERSKEAVPARDIAAYPIIVDLEAG